MEPLVVILLGAPGAGKGTQAARLAAERSLPHVSTGDLFRANIQRETIYGRRAKQYLDSGRLVPDEVVLEMLFDRVARPDCREGYVLDGFPRTVPQAEALDRRLEGRTQPRVIDLAVADDKLVERAAGRLVCPRDGSTYHRAFKPPVKAGTCDLCGAALVRRADDAPEVVRERLEVYHRQTEPVIDHYRAKGWLEEIDGEQSPDEVFKALEELVTASS
jgi:adenylate kinase